MCYFHLHYEHCSLVLHGGGGKVSDFIRDANARFGFGLRVRDKYRISEKAVGVGLTSNIGRQ